MLRNVLSLNFCHLASLSLFCLLCLNFCSWRKPWNLAFMNYTLYRMFA
jgi:hypothetical protein